MDAVKVHLENIETGNIKVETIENSVVTHVHNVPVRVVIQEIVLAVKGGLIAWSIINYLDKMEQYEGNPKKQNKVYKKFVKEMKRYAKY